MDIQTKKLALINRIIQHKDESILDKIALIFEEEKLEDLTEADIIQRSEKAEKDYKEGKVFTTEELLKITESW
ncbi:hypothetical protein [Marivirga sp.]|uniref:hypothetical protein n=1 Tax=Marivirga sp. TaxID=2018662 RepID=UPI0026013123|nr:hypothetical protein [Marivirga sp.]